MTYFLIASLRWHGQCITKISSSRKLSCFSPRHISFNGLASVLVIQLWIFWMLSRLTSYKSSLFWSLSFRISTFPLTQKKFEINKKVEIALVFMLTLQFRAHNCFSCQVKWPLNFTQQFGDAPNLVFYGLLQIFFIDKLVLQLQCWLCLIFKYHSKTHSIFPRKVI